MAHVHGGRLAYVHLHNGYISRRMECEDSWQLTIIQFNIHQTPYSVFEIRLGWACRPIRQQIFLHKWRNGIPQNLLKWNLKYVTDSTDTTDQGKIFLQVISLLCQMNCEFVKQLLLAYFLLELTLTPLNIDLSLTWSGIKDKWLTLFKSM